MVMLLYYVEEDIESSSPPWTKGDAQSSLSSLKNIYGYGRQLGCKKLDLRDSLAGDQLLCCSLVCPPTSPSCCVVRKCLCFPHLCRTQKTCPSGQQVTMVGIWGREHCSGIFNQGVFSKWPHLHVARTLGQGSGCEFRVRHHHLLATWTWASHFIT